MRAHKPMRRLLLTVALSVVIAAPAFAQQPLKLSFQDGRVTVDATSVPVRTILTEWGKVGGTKVVGAERITGAPMTREAGQRHRSPGPRNHLAKRRRLHGRTAQRRHDRSLDLRPHPRDGDLVRARAAGQCRAPVTRTTQRVRGHTAFRSAAPARRKSRKRSRSRTIIRRHRRCLRSRRRRRTTPSRNNRRVMSPGASPSRA